MVIGVPPTVSQEALARFSVQEMAPAGAAIQEAVAQLAFQRPALMKAYWRIAELAAVMLPEEPLFAMTLLFSAPKQLTLT